MTSNPDSSNQDGSQSMHADLRALFNNRAFWGRAVAFAKTKLQSWQDTEDAVQEALYRMYRNHAKYDDSSSKAETWFFVILNGAVRDIYKKNSRYQGFIENAAKDSSTWLAAKTSLEPVELSLDEPTEYQEIHALILSFLSAPQRKLLIANFETNSPSVSNHKTDGAARAAKARAVVAYTKQAKWFQKARESLPNNFWELARTATQERTEAIAWLSNPILSPKHCTKIDALMGLTNCPKWQTFRDAIQSFAPSHRHPVLAFFGLSSKSPL